MGAAIVPRRAHSGDKLHPSTVITNQNPNDFLSAIEQQLHILLFYIGTHNDGPYALFGII